MLFSIRHHQQHQQQLQPSIEGRTIFHFTGFEEEPNDDSSDDESSSEYDSSDSSETGEQSEEFDPSSPELALFHKIMNKGSVGKGSKSDCISTTSKTSSTTSSSTAEFMTLSPTGGDDILTMIAPSWKPTQCLQRHRSSTSSNSQYIMPYHPPLPKKKSTASRTTTSNSVRNNVTAIERFPTSLLTNSRRKVNSVA